MRKVIITIEVEMSKQEEEKMLGMLLIQFQKEPPEIQFHPRQLFTIKGYNQGEKTTKVRLESKLIIQEKPLPSDNILNNN